MKYSLTIISLYISSGILLGVGFLYPNLWPLGILGVALLLITLNKYPKGQIFGTYLAWFVKFLFVLGFYWSIYPIKWLPIDFGESELLLIGFYWITVSILISTGGLIFGIVYKLTKGALKSSPWLNYLALPILWVLAEIVGSFLLSVFTYGPGSLLNNYFSLGYIGQLLAQNQYLLMFAKVGGVYSLSFVVIVLSVWISNQKFNFKNPTGLIGVSLLFAVLVGSSYLITDKKFDSNQTVEVAVVSTSFPIEELFDRKNIPDLITSQEQALEAALATNSHYILLPEDARFFNQSDSASFAKNYFNFKYPNREVLIIDSGRVPFGDVSVLQGFMYDTATEEHYFMHKRYLVPQGEFVPYIYEGLFRLVGFGQLVDDLKQLLSYTIGPDTSQAKLPDDYPGLLFCFESTSPTGVRKLMSERPSLPFIVHPLSHNWFNSPESLWSQLDASLKIQAVWNDIAIVSAGNHGPSQLYLPNGKIAQPAVVASSEYWKVGIVDVPVK